MNNINPRIRFPIYWIYFDRVFVNQGYNEDKSEANIPFLKKVELFFFVSSLEGGIKTIIHDEKQENAENKSTIG